MQNKEAFPSKKLPTKNIDSLIELGIIDERGFFKKAPPCEGGGHRFDPYRLHHFTFHQFLVLLEHQRALSEALFCWLRYIRVTLFLWIG